MSRQNRSTSGRSPSSGLLRPANFRDAPSRSRDPRRNPRALFPAYCVESLERRLLFITISGIDDWHSDGPSPTNQGQVRGMDAQFNPVSGAVAALAPHPTNPDVFYIASVNGGVWRTRNARADFPDWQPLTDRFPTLSMGDITFDRADPSSQTLYAGIGTFSSGGFDGGTGSGILRTTDGGDTWRLLASTGPSSLAGERVEQLTANGNVVLAASPNNGLFRSTDSGQSFANVSLVPGSGLPVGPCTGLVRDPGVAGRYYAAVVGGAVGVFVTSDSGLTWAPTNNGQLSGLGAALRLRLALHRNTAANTFALYVAIIGNNRLLSGVFRSGNGINWAAMDTPVTNEGGTSVGIFPGGDEKEDEGNEDDDGSPGGGRGSYRPRRRGEEDEEEPGSQGNVHLSLEADPTNPNVVFIGGDRQPQNPGPDGIFNTTATPSTDDVWPNSIGSVDFTGRLFRGDASQPAGSQFYAITDTGLPANPNDGASNTAPHGDSRDIAFDAAGNMVESDDGGVYALINPNTAGRVWRARVGNLAVTEFYSVAYDARFNRTLGGAQDTGDPESIIGSVVPGSSQWQDVLGADGGIVASDLTNPDLAFHYYENQNMGGFKWRSYFPGPRGPTFSEHLITLLVTNKNSSGTPVNIVLRNFDSLPFLTRYAVNAVDGTRMIIGTGTAPGGPGYLYESFDRGDSLNSLGGLNAAQNGPRNSVGQVTALAYGAVNNANLLYVGTSNPAGPLLIRTAGTATPTVSATYPGSTPRDIALDPGNSDAYILDTAGRVWRTTDAGASAANWSNVTGDLGTVPGDKRTILVYRRGNAGALLVGGQGGVFRADRVSPSAVWQKFGRQLPHAPVNDLLYDVTSDLLIAGTFGRGAYVFRQASQLLTAQRFVTITADDIDEEFSVTQHPNLPGYISITRRTTGLAQEILDLELSTIDGLIIDGRGGDDSLSIGLARPNLTFPITFIGGTGDDTLNLGIGRLDVLPNLVTFDGVAGLNDRVNLFDQTNTTGIRYDITSDFVARSGFGGLRYANLDRLVLNCGSGDDTINLTVGAIAPVELHGNDGLDTIGFNDVANTTGRTWIINPEQVIIDGALTATNEFEAVALHAGNGPDKINISGGHTQSFDLDGGGGPDVFTVGFLSQVRFSSSGGPVVMNGGEGDDRFVWQNGSNNHFELLFGHFTDPVTLIGGGGSNTLLVDDTIRANTGYQLYTDRFYSLEPDVFPAGADFKYSGMASVDVRCSGGNNPVAVFGTAPTTGFSSFDLGGGADAVTVYPHDAAGNLTLIGGLSITGGPGSDTLTADNAASSRPITYQVDTPFGPLGTRIMGLGNGNLFASPDTESILLNGGAGRDTFRVHGLQTGSALRMNGLGDDDAVEVTPSFKKLEGNLTNAAFFGFDGGPGRNSFTIFNQNTSLPWTYTRPLGSLRAQSPNYGSFTFTLSNEQQTTVRSGPRDDTYRLVASAPGVKNQFFGGGGNDMMILGAAAGAALDGDEAGTTAAGGLLLNSIQGEALFDGEDGSDFATLDDSGSGVGKTVHLGQSAVGADPMDTLFGAGGSFRFEETETLELYLGAGSDSVVAQPNATAAVGIDSGTEGNHRDQDSLEVDLTGTENAQFIPDQGFPAATFIADNRQNLRVAFFESVDSFFNPTAVAGRHLFYNNSKFDGSDGAANAGDDGAIAPDKTALPPGQAGFFSNVSSYSRGINGIMIDVAGLPANAESSLSPADFIFRIGSDGDPNAWADAPSPSSVSVRRGAGDGGSDRVTVLFPDNSIRNTWLQVTLRGDTHSGLSMDDVFYVGSLVGETGDNPAVASVAATDLVRVRNAVGTGAAALASPFDFNRDGRIDAADLVLVRNNVGRTLPPLPSAAATSAMASRVLTRDMAPPAAVAWRPSERRIGVLDLLNADSTQSRPYLVADDAARSYGRMPRRGSGPLAFPA